MGMANIAGSFFKTYTRPACLLPCWAVASGEGERLLLLAAACVVHALAELDYRRMATASNLPEMKCGRECALGGMGICPRWQLSQRFNL